VPKAGPLTSSGQPVVVAAVAAECALVVVADALAVAEDAVVAVGDVVAADGDRRLAMAIRKSWPFPLLAANLWLAAAQLSPLAAAETKRAQHSFASPEEAATAFVAALRAHNESELRSTLGPDADRVIDSGDKYADKELQQHFVALYDEKHTINQTTPGHAELEVGPDDWPLPIPIVESGGHWTFDTKAGAQTIVDRRIGRNELLAIRTLLACVDAEHDYFDRARQNTGTGVYATRLLSTPGQQDGLYWPVAGDGKQSPLGPLVDTALEAGYPGESAHGKPIPYEGYYFRILKSQGPDGDGGAKNYIQAGRMTGGFALIAWPAVFASSGIMTFIVGPDGDVYQKDLGPETGRIAAEMTRFDPDLSWSRLDLTDN
jgi:hypothetical protein